MQLGRFSSYCEQTYRNQFDQKFDFLSFNKQLISQSTSGERIIALDPSYIPKAGKATYGRGRYWSGVAKAAKWGLDICGFAVVDIQQYCTSSERLANASADEVNDKGLNLLTYYASLVTDNSKEFKEFTDYMVADAYFFKKTFCGEGSIFAADLNFISRLRDDSVLNYKFKGGEWNKKRVHLKNTVVAFDVRELDLTDYFTLDLCTPEIKIYSGIVYSKAFKRDIKLAVAIFYNDNNKEIARKLYFCTDLSLSGEKIVKYYRSRFQSRISISGCQTIYRTYNLSRREAKTNWISILMQLLQQLILLSRIG